MYSPRKQTHSPSRARKSMAQSGTPSSPPESIEIYEKEMSARPFLPKEWCDSKRMNVLFSDFRVREANPEGWDANMTFWINAINKWSQDSDNAIISVETIRKAFERSGKMPQVNCIKLVLSEMKRRKLIVAKDELKAQLSDLSGQGWNKWTVMNALVVKPLSWSLSWVINKSQPTDCEEIDTSIEVETQLLNLQTFESIVSRIEGEAKKLGDSCVYYDSFYSQCHESLGITNDIFHLAISQLNSYKKLKYFEDKNIKLLKFGTNCSFTETEIGKMRLEAARKLIEKEVSRLENDMEECREEARTAVREKNNSKAKLILKRKKRLEMKLIDKDVQLDNIDVLLEHMLNADSHKHVLQAFKVANDALRANQVNMDGVENTVDNIEDAIETMSNLNSDISRPFGVDDINVDEELEQLLRETTPASQQTTSARKEDNKLRNLSAVLDDLDVVNDPLNDSLHDKEQQSSTALYA